MSGNKRLYTTMRCSIMTTEIEIQRIKRSNQTLEKQLLKRLKPSVMEGYWDLYPKKDVLTGIELDIIKRYGYELNSISVYEGRVRAIFYKKSE